MPSYEMLVSNVLTYQGTLSTSCQGTVDICERASAIVNIVSKRLITKLKPGKYGNHPLPHAPKKSAGNQTEARFVIS
jgi:hypothetical protein